MMNSKQLIELCQALRLKGFAEALMQQFESHQFDDASFEERLTHLLVAQQDFEINRKIANLTARAKLRWPNARVSEIDYLLHPNLKRHQIQKLAECQWITHYQHIILHGATGTGKTYIACAIANEALHKTHRVMFIRFQSLLLKMQAAHNEGEFEKFRNWVKKIEVLVLDDWGVALLDNVARHLLFEIIESRDQRSSLIITSQYPVGDWYDAFQDQTIADSTLDRIVHGAHILHLKGESIRRRRRGSRHSKVDKP
ncbi:MULTISPECIES: IS21-like element helper ATPase IstB [unclassified Pseudoalteromonas]|uniref:IS21-like element helper ATPase IstB n=1 Tax=unclassified Pseudoalteromonas TaxID=194690 RepID=UPI0030145665